MKIAIMSDSHDNIPNTEKALEYIKKEGIKTIIHCGDLSAPAMLERVILPEFSGELYLVCGNVGDCDLLKEVSAKHNNAHYFDEVGEAVLDGKKIVFCHFPDEAKELAQSSKYNIVFYGHTHKPWEEIANDIPVVNPGTLAGMFYKATFAIYDTQTDKLELKILEKI